MSDSPERIDGEFYHAKPGNALWTIYRDDGEIVTFALVDSDPRGAISKLDAEARHHFQAGQEAARKEIDEAAEEFAGGLWAELEHFDGDGHPSSASAFWGIFTEDEHGDKEPVEAGDGNYASGYTFTQALLAATQTKGEGDDA